MGSLVGWSHCPRCAGGLEVAGTRARCSSCGLVVYAHSDPTVCALLLDDEGRVLLTRRAREPHRGKWDLPGGFLDEGEHPLDALRRELLEETGLEVEADEFVGVWMDRYGDGASAPWTLNLFWTARIVRGVPSPADDVSELGWFPLDELPPEDELAFRNVALGLASLRAMID